MESSDKAIDLIGVKLTGDPNVPAGKITFQFSLSRAIVVPWSRQDDIEFLESLHHGPFHSIENPANLKQPFKNPFVMGVADEQDDGTNVVESCLCRFVGNGTIAGHGFTDPASIITHLLVLSPHQFLVLWFGDFMFPMLFEKVSENDRILKYL